MRRFLRPGAAHFLEEEVFRLEERRGSAAKTISSVMVITLLGKLSNR